MSRPAPVRITDYRDPIFEPAIAEIRDSVAPFADTLELSTDALAAQASAELRLDDFGGDGSWRDRLDVLTAALRDEAGLSPFGKLNNHAMLVGLLKNRLLLQDLLTGHPEIHDIDIVAPIIICGLPRTGTTHLHNLISADSTLRSLPYWESLEPFPILGEEPGEHGDDPRVARCKMACDFIEASMPLFKRMHEMTWDHVHEEIQLLAIDISTMLFETTSAVPSWRDYYMAHDQRAHYDYMKTVLKAITYLRGGSRWVLKSPQHLEQFPALLATFPDATFVVTHRDPVSVVISMVTMLSYSSRMSVAHPDPHRIGPLWAARLESMLRTCAETHDVLPPEQTIDVRFDEFMADDVAMVRRVYDVAGQPFTEQTQLDMNRFMSSHPRGRHGTVVYDFDDMALDPNQLEHRLDFYVRRFGLTRER
jgi:Sulfotransferase family